MKKQNAVATASKKKSPRSPLTPLLQKANKRGKAAARQIAKRESSVITIPMAKDERRKLDRYASGLGKTLEQVTIELLAGYVDRQADEMMRRVTLSRTLRGDVSKPKYSIGRGRVNIWVDDYATAGEALSIGVALSVKHGLPYFFHGGKMKPSGKAAK